MRVMSVCMVGIVMAASYAFVWAAEAPAVPVNRLREAYYGDLHLHTTNSFDAYIFTQLGPDEAYRFARGEPMQVMGEEVRRVSAPLDFLAVTDHAEWLGVMNALDDPDRAFSRSRLGRALREDFAQMRAKLKWPMEPTPTDGVEVSKISESVWQRAIEAANRHYRPGRFTTFIGYEWSSTPGGSQLHRNVIFRGDQAPAPFTAMDSPRPEDLWRFLQRIRAQGYEALAIPHNPNFSNGLAFDWIDSDGRPIDEAYAEQRAAHEPLVEIAQSKGTSETHPGLAANDEFASFEVMEIAGHSSDRLAGSYARNALGRGLQIAGRGGGVNPFKFGFAGGSDFHSGMTDSAERAFSGITGPSDPTRSPMDLPQRLEQLTMLRGEMGASTFASMKAASLYRAGSGALTGVWAESNTREAIYDALRRKETFATSGTRLKFRFFGGWSFDNRVPERRDFVRLGYAQGVPMGSDLPARPARARAPQFLLWAVKDPDGANLDRLQIVKIGLKEGLPVEKIHDVTYANSIGTTELAAHWRDPDFDPGAPAVYYLRVLEIPTPRWSTILAARLGRKPPDGVPASIQERGWSSPIWYTPPPAPSASPAR
jgi:predicted metal-dependent phosphoesterase TrpH